MQSTTQPHIQPPHDYPQRPTSPRPGRANQKKFILRKKPSGNEAGQSLIEYLLLTSLMAVATMGVMRVMSHSVNAKFAQITESIQGKDPGEVKFDSVVGADYEKKDMSNFMEGATKGKKHKEKENGKKPGVGIFGPSEFEF